MKPAQSKLLLAAGLAVTLALVYFAPTEDAPVEPAKQRNQRAAPTRVIAAAALPGKSADAAVEPTATLVALPRSEPSDKVPDLFKSMSWYVPPPPPPPKPPPPPPPPPPPTAPPLPFTYLGQYIDEGVQQLILARGERIVTVKVGENIDSTYKVESAKGGQAVLVYLPLNIKQTLSTGVTQ